MTQNTDTAPLKEYLATAVAYIIGIREERRRPPYMATYDNIRNVLLDDLGDALAEMCAEGLLTRHTTVNSRMYKFTPPA